MPDVGEKNQSQHERKLAKEFLHCHKLDVNATPRLKSTKVLGN